MLHVSIQLVKSASCVRIYTRTVPR